MQLITVIGVCLMFAGLVSIVIGRHFIELGVPLEQVSKAFFLPAAVAMLGPLLVAIWARDSTATMLLLAVVTAVVYAWARQWRRACRHTALAFKEHPGGQ